MSESAIQKACMDLANSLKKSGYPVYLFRTNAGVFRSMQGGRIVKGCPEGHPDVSGTINGRSVYIEFKNKKGRVSEAQMQRKAEIESAGGEWISFRSIADFRVWIFGRIV